MQKIFSILIAGFMFASFILNDLSVSAKEKYIEYIVPFYSDKINQNRVIGISNESLLKEGIVLIPLKTACEIAGASIKSENDDAVIISRNYVSWCCQYNDKKNQYLLVDSNTGEGDFYESSLKCLVKPSWSGVSFKYAIDCVGDHAGIVTLPVDNSYKTEIDYEFYNNELYVSFYDFLVMMGVDVNISGRDIQLELVKSFLYNMGIDVTDNNVNTLVDYIFAQVMGEYDLNLFFSCCLRTPVDELYMNYYEKQKDLYMCDLTDYYSDGDVKWANLVNSMASFNGITETVLASMNLNTDYSEVLVNIVSNVGMNSSQNNDSDLMLQGALEGINSNATEENKKDWNLQKTSFLLQYGWDTESLTSGIINDMDDIFNKIVYNAQGYKFEGIDLGTADGISIAFGAFTTGLEYYDKYKALNTLFDNDENLLKNSILCSDYLKQSMQDEFGDDFISKGRKFIGRGAVFNENLLNTSDSYINLYRSASEIQLLMETSAPATWGAIQKAYKNAAMATLDTIILKTIDGFAFTGVPVTEFAVQFIQYVSKEISNHSYVKQKSKIAEFDNFVFVQEVAKGCFNSFDLSSENAFSSFVLGVKASLTAYEAENEIRKSSDIQNRIEMLKSMLDQTTFANRDFYRINTDRCSDLTEMIGENTDISKIDDTLVEDYSELVDIIIENEINYEEIYYNYIENELVPKYGLASLEPFDVYIFEKNSMPTSSFGIISADIHDYNNDNLKDLLLLTLEASKEEDFCCDLKLYFYILDEMMVELKDVITLNNFYSKGDIYSGNYFTLSRCDNNLLFTNIVGFFSGEGYASKLIPISVKDDKFMFTQIILSSYHGKNLYIDDEMVNDTNSDESFSTNCRLIIEEELDKININYDEVVYDKGKYSVKLLNEKILAQYTAISDTTNSDRWKSIITPNEYTDLRLKIFQSIIGR